MSTFRAQQHSGKLYERLQNHIQSNLGKQADVKQTLTDALSSLNAMQAAEIRQLNIATEGEFMTCVNAKEALDAVNHIKSVLRSRGFGCYALHNYIWIVPFVHESIHIPDFERAKAILPDLKAALFEKAFPQQCGEAMPITQKTKQATKRLYPMLLSVLSLLGTALSLLVYRVLNAK